MRHAAIAVAGSIGAALMLSGCMAPMPPESQATMAEPIEYSARGTVIDNGTAVMLCHGVLQSYPPQCGGGVEVIGWDWDSILHESSRAVTWVEDVVVTGTVDRAGALTVTRAPDPSPPSPSPATSRAFEPSGLTDAELEVIRAESTAGKPYASSVQEGVVWILVPFDDGSLQATFDDRYGHGVVIVDSMLHPVEK